MKIKYISKALLFTITGFAILFLRGQCYSEDGFHYRETGFFDTKVVFNNTDTDLDLISSFPIEIFLKDKRVVSANFNFNYVPYWNVEIESENSLTEKITLEYLVFASIEDAEIYWAELRGHTSHGYYHTIYHAAYLDETIEIGHNCWIAADKSSIAFIRNNVLVQVSVPLGNSIFSIKSILSFIDTLLIDYEKVSDCSQMSIPMIERIEIVYYDYSNKEYNLKIIANDPNGQELYYLVFAGNWSKNLVKSFRVDTEQSNIKIWVMNERHLVATKDIFDTRRGER